MKITSRAAIVRAIKEPGVVIRVLSHWQAQLVGSTRTPTKTQTNGYYFEGLNHELKPCRMWAELPPAVNLKFNDDGTVTFYPDTPKSWTLAFEITA